MVGEHFAFPENYAQHRDVFNVDAVLKEGIKMELFF
jgi:hypothetical protein